MEQQVENTQDQNNKEVKRFDTNLKKMIGLLNNNKDVLFKQPKVPNSQIKDIVEELFAEETKVKRESLKVKIKEMCIAHINFTKEEKKAREELEKTIINKKKELNKSFEAIFNEVENINLYLKDFEAAAGAGEEPKKVA
jgi:D-ribose pyranose/furanose isomerase RbsD